MMAKPMKSLESHYPMIQFLISTYILQIHIFIKTKKLRKGSGNFIVEISTNDDQATKSPSWLWFSFVERDELYINLRYIIDIEKMVFWKAKACQNFRF